MTGKMYGTMSLTTLIQAFCPEKNETFSSLQRCIFIFFVKQQQQLVYNKRVYNKTSFTISNVFWVV